VVEGWNSRTYDCCKGYKNINDRVKMSSDYLLRVASLKYQILTQPDIVDELKIELQNFIAKKFFKSKSYQKKKVINVVVKQPY